MREIAGAGIAESAHDLSDGGLAVTLSESCTADLGANVTCGPTAEGNSIFQLFGESPSRILLTTSEPEKIQEIAARHDVKSPIIGVTIKGRLQIGYEDRMLINIATADLKQSFEGALPRLLQSQHAC